MHLFFGEEAKYINRNQEINENEVKCLNSVKNDDVLVLSKKRLDWEYLDGHNLANFLQEICEDGAIVAYVTQAKPPKKVGKNYHSLVVTGQAFEDLDEGVEEFNCYHLESMLPEHRQYTALHN